MAAYRKMKDIIHLIECDQYEDVGDLGEAHVCSGAIASKESNHGSLHFLEDRNRERSSKDRNAKL